jgi:uncharacterized phage protein gp47/JayE
MINRITSDEYAQQLKDAINSRNPTYDTEVGPIPDLIVYPAARVFELQNERIRAVQQLLSLINDGSFTDSDLDDFVYNEQLIRLPGAKSQVTLTFSRATIPTSDITIKANFPVSTLPDENTGESYMFMTLVDATLYASNAASYYNANTGKYELNVAAESVLGTAANMVGTNRVTRPSRPLVNFDSVTNVSVSTGGSDAETNVSIISRYYLSLMGTSPAPVSGIKKILRNVYTQVLDSNIVFGNNPLNVRSATDGGAVDTYVIGNTPLTAIETIVFPGVSQVVNLTSQPINSISLVKNVATSYIYTQDIDFVLVKDVSGNAGSVRAIDGIRWLPTGACPAVGESIEVTYAYNALMLVLQNAFLADDKNIPSRDMLFKVATQADVTLTARIKVKAGYTVTSVVDAARQAILALVNGYLLNEPVEASDIQAIVRSFSSVGNFIIDNLSRVGSTGVSDIAIGANEYARIAEPDLVITVIA